eukprot:Nitzschia sp. Nitz4//scaffold22_size323478//252460//253505//NITZ4_000573-RA/size323478-snap-gene-0.566-mRNA-1//-1//CDS//3329543133//5662//frame0
MWKCANNQIDGFWRHMFEGVTASTSEEVIRDLERSRYFFTERFSNSPTSHQECVVAVVRDPISHFLSGYNEVEFRIEAASISRGDIAMAWPFGNQEIGSAQRFQQFIIDLLSCPIENNLPGILDMYPQQLEIQHVFSMSSVLHLLAKEQASTNVTRQFFYLPSLHNLTNNLGPFLVQSCPDSFSGETKQKLLSTKVNTHDGEHESSKDPTGSYTASKQVWKEGGSFSRALCALHVMDYACWRDLPEGVPGICLEVYERPVVGHEYLNPVQAFHLHPTISVATTKSIFYL